MRKALVVTWDPVWADIMIEGPRPTYGDRFEFGGVSRTIIGFKPGADPVLGCWQGTPMWRTTVRAQETGKPYGMLLRDVEAYESDPRRPPLRHVTEWRDLRSGRVSVRESYLDDAP